MIRAFDDVVRQVRLTDSTRASTWMQYMAVMRRLWLHAPACTSDGRGPGERTWRQEHSRALLWALCAAKSVWRKKTSIRCSFLHCHCFLVAPRKIRIFLMSRHADSPSTSSKCDFNLIEEGDGGYATIFKCGRFCFILTCPFGSAASDGGFLIRADNSDAT
jgi:hypothetical protein